MPQSYFYIFIIILIIVSIIGYGLLSLIHYARKSITTNAHFPDSLKMFKLVNSTDWNKLSDVQKSVVEQVVELLPKPKYLLGVYIARVIGQCCLIHYRKGDNCVQLFKDPSCLRLNILSTGIIMMGLYNKSLNDKLYFGMIKVEDFESELKKVIDLINLHKLDLIIE